MGIGIKILRAMFGVIVFVGVILFLFVGILANSTSETAKVVVPSTGNFKHYDFIEPQKHAVHHQDLNLNYVSKRRVPNGPDPIHNRRAVKYSRQPPGRV